MPKEHPIFDDIWRSDIEAAKQRVLTDPGVLEERDSSYYQRTSLMVAIYLKKPAIALWLIEHRGQHDVNTRNRFGTTALHWACMFGPLSVVQALVAAGADVSCFSGSLGTPLMCAIRYWESTIVAYLLQQPAVTQSINTIRNCDTALSFACFYNHAPIVQLLDGRPAPTPSSLLVTGHRSPPPYATAARTLLPCSAALCASTSPSARPAPSWMRRA